MLAGSPRLFAMDREAGDISTLIAHFEKLMADRTSDFLASHPVFSLEEAVAELTPELGSDAARQRLKYAAAKGRVKPISRGFFAAVPPGLRADRFEPDRYLVASTVRPDAVFAYHSAFELLGAGHSDWSRCTVLTMTPRGAIDLRNARIEFLVLPRPFRGRNSASGLCSVDRLGRSLSVTGPERTLLDALRQPGLAGGLAEVLESASGFGVLDLDVLLRLLRVYGEKRLWAAAGWFLERFQRTFFVPDEYLSELERHHSSSRQYLVRGQRGGVLARRWNLIVPREADRLAGGVRWIA
jgi:predicted transcriptional regulator of viral defense system